MSLYRQPGRPSARTFAVVAAVALLAGGGGGYAIGAAGGDEPASLPDALEQLRADLKPAVAAMDLVGTEYEQAVRDGRVVAPTEYAAAKADVQRAREVIQEHAADLAALDRLRAVALERTLSQLAAAIARHADQGVVDRLATAAREALGTTVPRRGS